MRSFGGYRRTKRVSLMEFERMVWERKLVVGEKEREFILQKLFYSRIFQRQQAQLLTLTEKRRANSKKENLKTK